MALLDRLAWWRKSATVGSETEGYGVFADLLRQALTSASGKAVTRDSAFKVATFFACLRVLSEGVAQVPFKLLRETYNAQGLRQINPARDMALYDLVDTQPNDWTDAFQFRETQVLHAGVAGNAYAFVNRVLGAPAELILLDPSRVRPAQAEDWTVTYHVRARNGTERPFPAAAIWHVRGPSWDGIAGLDTLKLAREALGLSMATEETHAQLHAQGVRPTGVITVADKLTPDQYTQLRNYIDQEGAGLKNAARPLIIDRGATWATTSMTGLDAQHLETRRFQIEEICRFMRVMPIMVGYSDKTATYASVEQMLIAHVVHTLAPWYTRIEKSADARLLTREERAQGLYFKHNANALLRGSFKDRGDYYSKALGAGGSPAWLTQDEIRALEEFNPMGGKAAELPIATNVPKAPGAQGGTADNQPQD